MAFEDVSSSQGRRGHPCMRAICDECGRDEVFACLAGDSGRASKKVQQMGWAMVKGTLHCPACERKRKAGNMAKTGSRQVLAKKTTTPPPPKPGVRQPTREQRREIMGLLEVSYDPDAGRYKGTETDETVADVLGVMPGWVAEIHEGFFGPSGGNEECEALAAEIVSFLTAARAQMMEQNAAIGKLGELTEQARGLAERLAKVEKAVGPRVMARAK